MNLTTTDNNRPTSWVLFDSYQGKKKAFVPVEPHCVRMYVCGLTVYADSHIGHIRTLIVYDSFVRHLRAQGWKVEYVRNITDVDDKILQRAADTEQAASALTEHFIERIAADERRIGLLKPDRMPRATEHISHIIAFIEGLIEKGAAYQADNGDVYFRVRRCERYGQLSKKSVDELQVGSRVMTHECKEDGLDFVLWKSASQKAELTWDSPWGWGRPGWHIECSAMSSHYLGQVFDIHGGGVDLKFPHHENEIAQSQTLYGCLPANYWMHCGHVQVRGEKMSKSLGNMVTTHELLDAEPYPQVAGEVLRLTMLGSHYRHPLHFDRQLLDHARYQLKRYYQLRNLLEAEPQHAQASASCPDSQLTAYVRAFSQALNDDFNTPLALTSLNHCVKEAYRRLEHSLSVHGYWSALVQMWGVLGLVLQPADPFVLHATEQDEALAQLLQRRQHARVQKNWHEADRIRDQLNAMGYAIIDLGHGESRLEALSRSQRSEMP